MKKEEIKIYEPALGLDGTIPQLVDWANRYTHDYTDEALDRISGLASQLGFEEKYVKVPLLLKDERKREREKESGDGVGTPYERMKIDEYLLGEISYSESNYGLRGTELEIRQEGGFILIALTGMDDEGPWAAAGRFCMKEFMEGEYGWLDSAIGQVLFYTKTYEEAV